MKHLIKLCMTAGLCICLLKVEAQSTYWVYFKGKDLTDPPQLSPKTIEQRVELGLNPIQFSDLPVRQQYLDYLDRIEATTFVTSRWLNAVVVELRDDQKESLMKCSFVTGIRPINGRLVPTSSEIPLRSGLALKQIHAANLSADGLNGRGIVIGIIDNGFAKADIDPYLKSIFEDNRLMGVKDFFSTSEKMFFRRVLSAHDNHGSEVWKLIGGHDKQRDHQLGLAPEASYYLARTDNGEYEFRQEEANWVAALEWLDSLGVRLVHSSLGYSKDFDLNQENYSPENMDGQTAVTSRAAKIAIKDKGMIIVTSAGNEGADPDWRVISSPADVPEVIAVGATNIGGKKQAISGIGISESSIPNPDVSCFSNGGTSFAAPIVTGLIACLLQQNPLMKNDIVHKRLIRAADLYPFGNNYVGFGVPNANYLLELDENTHDQDTIRTDQNTYELTGKKGLVFHKTGAVTVLKQQELRGKDGSIVINQLVGSDRVTIKLQDRVVELFWE